MSNKIKGQEKWKLGICIGSFVVVSVNYFDSKIMGGHGHGHGDPYTVPDAKIYKVEAPQLVEVKNALARLGLKDPWLRNEAWRYDKMHGTHATRAKTFFLRGFPLGLGLAVISAGLGYIAEQGDEHGEHGGHGGNH